MGYEEVLKIVEENYPKTRSFRLHTINGEKKIIRLFTVNNNIFEYRKYSKRYGYPLSTTYSNKWVSLKPILPTEDFILVKNFLTNVVKYLSKSGLWENFKKDYIKVLEQGDDYIKKLITLDYSKQREFLYSTLDIYSLHVDDIVTSARKGIVQINYHSYSREEFRNKVKEIIKNRGSFHYNWRKGYDNSIEFRENNNGLMVGWYSTEYKGMGNGHYYFALDEQHAIFGESD